MPDNWFSVYVPAASATSTPTPTTQSIVTAGGTNESYLRLGNPNTSVENNLKAALRLQFADSLTAPAVESAFGATPKAGAVLYTAGDHIQFINGTSDTRVLKNRYIVHVLNKEKVDTAAAYQAANPNAKSTDVPQTFRAYLRLGTPDLTVEGTKSMKAPTDDTVAAADLVPFVGELRPTPTTTIDDELEVAYRAVTITRDASGNPTDVTWHLDASGREAATGTRTVTHTMDSGQTFLVNKAKEGHGGAIDKLAAIRDSTTLASTLKEWATAKLSEVHDTFATYWSSRVTTETTSAADQNDARTRLASRTADGLVRAKIKSIQSSGSTAKPTASDLDAVSWAKRVLPAEQMADKYSLGAGIAMYSDKLVQMTAAGALDITTAKNICAVLGESYNYSWDVPDDVIDKIKKKDIIASDGIPDKKLVTATIIYRSGFQRGQRVKATDAIRQQWRTGKFDLSKTLTYSLADTAAFSVSSAYAFNVGLKFTNGASAAFDASLGIAVGAPLSLKVDVKQKSIETSWTRGKYTYKSDEKLEASSVRIAHGKVTDLINPLNPVIAAMQEKFCTVVHTGVVLTNVALAAYTGTVGGIGIATTSETEGKSAIRDHLEAGEYVYMAVAVLNTIFLAAGTIIGIMHLTKCKTDMALAANPVQVPNILVNKKGIKLQVGATFIVLEPSGISIHGPKVTIGGQQQNVPSPLIPGSATPPEILEWTQLAQPILDGILA